MIKAALRSTFVALVLMLPAELPAQEPPPRPGNHFVVLIDDSKDMEGFKSALERHLPGFLYDGGQGVNNRPRFEPARDSLSVVFFTVHPDGQRADRCPKARRYSVLSRYMFELADVAPSGVATKDAFRAQLREWLQLGCRFDGRLSPIATATSLVLPELGKSLPSDQRFARTILINATNGYFNSTASPGYELRNFLRIQDDINKRKLVRDIEATQRQLQAVAPLFESPEQWNLKTSQPGNQPLYLSAFEAKPLVPTPEGLLTYRRQLPLDRVALSNEEIRLDAEIPGQSEIHITLPASDKAVRLVPTGLYWRFYQGRREELGQSELRPWKVGATSLPYNEQWLDLETCGMPCRVSDDKLTVPFIELAGGLTVRPRDHMPSESSTFEFSVTFRFDTGGSYDRLSLETRRQWIELRPVQPIEVPAGPFFPVKTLDNRALAELWRPGDAESASAGLTQRVAADRVLAARDEYQLLILIGSVLGAVLLIVAVLYFLYKTAYQRPFEPRLEWQPAEEVLLDFDRPAASRMLTGTLRVVNPTEVPWFGQRLGNDEQPTFDAELEIEVPDLKHTDIVAAENSGPFIGFMTKEGDEATGSALLNQHTHEAVSDGRYFYVFIALDSIQDLKLKDRRQIMDSTSIIVPKVTMKWQPYARKPSRRLTTETPFKLRVKPENARPPRIEFRPSQEKTFYQHGKPLKTGHFFLRSRAEHEFAKPFVGDYRLVSSNNHQPLPGGAFALSETSINLPPKSEHSVAVIIECDGRVIPEPGIAPESYDISLMGPADKDSNLGPFQILLHGRSRPLDIIQRFFSEASFTTKEKVGVVFLKHHLDHRDGVAILWPSAARIHATIGGLVHKQEQLQSEISRLESRRAATETEVGQAFSNQAETERRRSSLLENPPTTPRNSGDLDRIRRAQRSYRDRLDRWHHEIANLDRTIADLSHEVTACRQRIDQYEEEILRSRKEWEQLHQEIAVARTSIEAVRDRREFVATCQRIEDALSQAKSNRVAYIIYDDLEPSKEDVHDLRRKTTSDVVLISMRSLKLSIGKENSHQTLQDLEAPYITRTDPYLEQNPIIDPNWFFGREDLLRNLSSAIRQGNHIGVFGLRKLGKTALAKQLRQRLTDVPSVWIDCQHMTLDPQEYFDKICNELASDSRISPTGTSRKINKGANQFKKTLLAHFGRWRELGRPEPFWIVFDEVDKLFIDRSRAESSDALHAYATLFRTIRGLAQEERCLVITVIAHRAEINRQNKLPATIGDNPMFSAFREVHLVSRAVSSHVFD